MQKTKPEEIQKKQESSTPSKAVMPVKKESILVFSKRKFKLKISNTLESKIRHLCSVFPSNEWSGICFYRTTGSFIDKDSPIEVEAVDMVLMDIGNSTFTDYRLDDSPEAACHLANNLDLFDCDLGVIHSHHNMKTFFSGTDKDTLEQLGSEFNHIFSLIVNNDRSYEAAITRKTVSKFTIVQDYEYRTFGDELITHQIEKEEERTRIEAFYFDIDYLNPYSEELNFRIEEIKKEKKQRAAEEAKKRAESMKVNIGFRPNSSGYRGGYQRNLFQEGYEECDYYGNPIYPGYRSNFQEENLTPQEIADNNYNGYGVNEQDFNEFSNNYEASIQNSVDEFISEFFNYDVRTNFYTLDYNYTDSRNMTIVATTILEDLTATLGLGWDEFKKEIKNEIRKIFTENKVSYNDYSNMNMYVNNLFKNG